MAFLKLKISQVFDSILEQIHSTAHNKVLHTTVSRFRQPLPHPSHKYSPQPWALTKQPKSCPLCKQASRNDQPFLSSYPYLPPEDHTYLSQSHVMSTLDNKDPDYMDYSPPLFTDKYEHPSCWSHVTTISPKQSPLFKAFYRH